MYVVFKNELDGHTLTAAYQHARERMSNTQVLVFAPITLYHLIKAL